MFDISEDKIGELREFCEAEGITWLAVFGSAAKGLLTPGSDIDILVEFSEPVGIFALVRIENDLSAKFFDGRKVDLVTKKGLDEFIRHEVLSSCEVIYGKAG